VTISITFVEVQLKVYTGTIPVLVCPILVIQPILQLLNALYMYFLIGDVTF